jgi:hypothetical protein
LRCHTWSRPRQEVLGTTSREGWNQRPHCHFARVKWLIDARELDDVAFFACETNSRASYRKV